MNIIPFNLHEGILKEGYLKSLNVLRISLKSSCRNSNNATESFDISKPILNYKYKAS